MSEVVARGTLAAPGLVHYKPKEVREPTERGVVWLANLKWERDEVPDCPPVNYVGLVKVVYDHAVLCTGVIDKTTM